MITCPLACNLKKKLSCVNWFVLEKFLNENATRKKKKPYRLMKGVEKSMRSKVQIDYRGYFLDVGKVLTILLLSKTLLV